ncbi:unnamed protein product [Aureobasidium pullulans]|nr:unnamed protein product [Aureobasidium pullulans]
MASVYDATRTSTFRCDNVSYPADDYYVAFWTRYDSSLALSKNSQPAPINCGQRLKFTNPLTGLSASGVVLDRCASCIGVGDLSLNDPTTNEGLVNGATVDFSRELWNKIYNGAPGDVYDVIYVGDPLQESREFLGSRVVHSISKGLSLGFDGTLFCVDRRWPVGVEKGFCLG